MTDLAPTAQLDIGRVISRAFAAIGANFVNFLIVVVVFATVPSVLISLGVDYFVDAALANGSLDIVALSLVTFAMDFVASAPAYVAVAAVTHASMVTFNGGQASLGDGVATGVGRMLPLFVLGIVSTIAILAAMILLIVPGIIVAVVLSVAVPAMVVEKRGISGSMSRSSDLTEGNRWRIFWLVVIAAVASWLIGMVADGLLAGFSGAPRVLGSVGPVTVSVSTTIVSALAETLGTIITSAGIAALYYELRTGKEGTTSQELASVFD